MKAPIATITLLAVLALGATPAIAQDRDAARAACTTYAQVKTEVAPSASPRLEPPASPARGVQAPGMAISEPELARKDPEFRQAFRDCIAKLEDEVAPSASPRLEPPALTTPPSPGIQAPGTTGSGASNADRR